MKILLFSDIHLDAVTAGVSRFDEFDAYAERLITTIREEDIDVVLFGGDAFDPGSKFESLYSSTLIQLALDIECARAPRSTTFIAIAGNHDVVETSRLLTTLSPLEVATRDCPNINVVEKPEARVISFPHLEPRIQGNNYAFVCMPYVSSSANREEWWDDLYDTTDKILAPKIVLGHLTVEGARMGSESREMARGRDMLFPAERVASWNPVAVFNGHYHKAQTARLKGVDIHVPGSPHRFEFGERDDKDKGFIIAEV